MPCNAQVAPGQEPETTDKHMSAVLPSSVGDPPDIFTLCRVRAADETGVRTIVRRMRLHHTLVRRRRWTKALDRHIGRWS